jgi:hypothetical protein
MVIAPMVDPSFVLKTVAYYHYALILIIFTVNFLMGTSAGIEECHRRTNRVTSNLIAIISSYPDNV